MEGQPRGKIDLSENVDSFLLGVGDEEFDLAEVWPEILPFIKENLDEEFVKAYLNEAVKDAKGNDVKPARNHNLDFEDFCQNMVAVNGAANLSKIKEVYWHAFAKYGMDFDRLEASPNFQKLSDEEKEDYESQCEEMADYRDSNPKTEEMMDTMKLTYKPRGRATTPLKKASLVLDDIQSWFFG